MAISPRVTRPQLAKLTKKRETANFLEISDCNFTTPSRRNAECSLPSMPSNAVFSALPSPWSNLQILDFLDLLDHLNPFVPEPCVSETKRQDNRKADAYLAWINGQDLLIGQMISPALPRGHRRLTVIYGSQSNRKRIAIADESSRFLPGYLADQPSNGISILARSRERHLA